MHAENILEKVKKSPLVRKYINGELVDKVYFINADGGYGKTTALNCLYYYLVNMASSGNHIVPIFIDVKLLMDFGDDRKNEGLGNMPRPLERYIVRKYCGYDSDPDESLLEKVINIFSKNISPEFHSTYIYYIFVDGINEVDDSTKRIILTEIKEMLECEHVKFFISSRIDEKELPDETIKFKLKPLEEQSIRRYLDNNFGSKYREKVDISKINDSLVEILRVPMYLSVFRKTYDEKSPYPDIYEQTTVRKADLLDSYVQKILKDNKQKKRKEYNPLIEFVINYYLPALAFLMIKENGFSIDFDSLEKLDINYFKTFFKGSKRESLKDIVDSKHYKPLLISCDTFSLIKENDDGVSFVHQNWRDLFVAKHIINCMNAEKLDELEESVYPNIRQFVGELIREYDYEFKYSKNYDDDNDNRKCECDFEKKDNLKTWSDSPIEHFMKHNDLGDSSIVTKNLIEIMKTCRNGNITSSYDGLDLKYVSFFKCNLKGSTFNNTKVYSYNFIPPGHTESVNSVAFSPDGTKIVSGSWDETIRIWDVETGLQAGEPLTGHTGSVNSVAFSLDGTKIVSGSWDKTIRIWDAETGKQIGEPLTGHTDYVTSVAFSSDGTKIVSGSRDKTIRIWDVKTGLQIGEPLTGHTDCVNSVAFSPDCEKIVSGSWDETIRIWDAKTGNQICKSLIKHIGSIYSVSFSSDGVKIAIGSDDEIIYIWDVANGFQIGKPFMGHTGSVYSVSFSPDGRKIVSSSDDETIRVWDVETGLQIGKPFIGHTSWVNSVAFSPDGTKIVSGSNDKTIRVWDVKTGKQAGRIIVGHNHFVSSVAISHDGTKLISGSENGTIQTWNSKTGLVIGEPIIGHTDCVNSVAFSPNDTKIVSGSLDRTIRIWNSKTSSEMAELSVEKMCLANCVSFSPDGKKIVSGNDDDTIRIWDTETGKQIGKPFIEYAYFVNSLAFSPNGTKIASGSGDGTIYIWNAETGLQIGAPLTGHIYFVTSVSFSPDGTKIVSGGYDKSVRIWDIETGLQVGDPLTGHTSWVNSVAFSPDGTRIVSGSDDKTIRIWDAKTGTQIGEPLIGHTGRVNFVSFSFDGKNIVSGSSDSSIRNGDGTIRIWDLISHLCTVIEPISSYISNCDFRNANYSGNDKGEFYKTIYSNGGIIKKEYEPKPIPFEYNEGN